MLELGRLITHMLHVVLRHVYNTSVCMSACVDLEEGLRAETSSNQTELSSNQTELDVEPECVNLSYYDIR